MQPAQPTNIVMDKIENGYIVVFRGKVTYFKDQVEAVEAVQSYFSEMKESDQEDKPM